MLEAKANLPQRLDSILPADVLRDKELTELCHNLCDPDPDHRVSSAEEANLEWAANVHRRLVKTGLDSDYENDIRVLMEALPLDLGEKIEPAMSGATGSAAESQLFGDSTILI